jgi:hypothetical protein
MTNKYLEIYLRDHLAAATAGVEFTRRCARENEGTPEGVELREMVDGLKDEREVLKTLMERLEVAPSQVKNALAVVAERMGRLKLNGELTRYSPLSHLLEIEGLMSAVEARSGLWRTIREAQELEPTLQSIPTELLIEQAELQRKRLEQFHQRAARRMLFGDGGEGDVTIPVR